MSRVLAQAPSTIVLAHAHLLHVIFICYDTTFLYTLNTRQRLFEYKNCHTAWCVLIMWVENPLIKGQICAMNHNNRPLLATHRECAWYFAWQECTVEMQLILTFNQMYTRHCGFTAHELAIDIGLYNNATLASQRFQCLHIVMHTLERMCEVLPPSRGLESACLQRAQCPKEGL